MTDEVIQKLSRCLRSTDTRTVASAREALYKLKPELITLQTFIESENNRAAADALIDLIKSEGFLDTHYQKLAQWLSSDDKSFKLSALYAVYSIYEYWAKDRQEYLALNDNFEKIENIMMKIDKDDVAYAKWLEMYTELKRRTRRTSIDTI